MPADKPFKFPSALGLSQGDHSQAVEDLQEFLRRFGYLHVPLVQESDAAVDAAPQASEVQPGIFDEATFAALSSYQRFHGLPITGKLNDATVTEMSMPRCGFPDIPPDVSVSSFVAQGNQWDHLNLTYSFQELTPDLTGQQIRDAILGAFVLWSQVTWLTFTEVANNADIVIRFVGGDHGDSFSFDGVGRVLAHAFSPPPNGGTLAGDAHFDEDETWTVNIPQPTGGIDLVTVAAHEFGHSLGLNHTSIRGALMFPTFSGPHRFLATDDIDGIQSIYGGLIVGRIGALNTDGLLWVKEGALDAAWVLESGTVQSFALVGDRIGVLHTDGTLWVKEGALDAAWVEETWTVQSFALGL
jgi:predicted Zn-dependent protease